MSKNADYTNSVLQITVIGNSLGFTLYYEFDGNSFMVNTVRRDEFQLLELLKTEIPTVIRTYLGTNTSGTQKIGFQLLKRRYIPVTLRFPTQFGLDAQTIDEQLTEVAGIKTLKVEFCNGNP